MPIDFPSSPAVGQRYGYAGINYIYTAQGVWSVTSTGVATNGSNISVQKFTASGTYTPTPGTQFAIVECVGGGGGGGGAQGDNTNFFSGGGGGSGGYSRSYLTAAQIGTSQVVTIGTGGPGNPYGVNPGAAAGTATSFGTLVVANGGGGGFRNDAGTAPQIGRGGAGAAPGVGDIAAPGASGPNGLYSAIGSTAVQAATTPGASSPFGGGAPSAYSTGNQGQAAIGYGAGGGGGKAVAASSGDGGAGSSGIVIVTEFNIATGPAGPVGPSGSVSGATTQPQGRLTLQSQTPVMANTVTSSSIIYYTAYAGDRVPIYNGTAWSMMTLPGGEISCLSTDTTKNPAAIGPFKVNDWFVWNDAGTLRLSHGIDWTNDTTRNVAGGGITRINGLWVNSASIPNGPTSGTGTYVGTTRSGASVFVWVFGSKAAGGGQGSLCVWNAYNRVNINSLTMDSTATWTYGGAWRAANNSANNRCYFVVGLQEDSFSATYAVTASVNNTDMSVGVGYDSVSTPAGTAGYSYMGGAGAAYTTGYATAIPTPGLHYLQALEAAITPTPNFYGTAGQPGTLVQNGLSIQLRM